MKRLAPLLILLALMAASYFLGIWDLLSFDALKGRRIWLKSLVASHPVLAPLLFMAVYTVSTALSIPGGAALSIFGGFLFPQPYSTLFAVTGATCGALIVFLIARSTIGESLRLRAGPWLQKMRKGFQENAASYLLFLRLVPLFPFWLVNIAPAVFDVRLLTFAWTTFIGIIPGAFVFTQAGVGLGAILDKGDEFTLGSIFNLQVKIALIALALFALLPVLVQKLRKKKP